MIVIFVILIPIVRYNDRLRRDKAWAAKMQKKVDKLRHEKYMKERANRPYLSAKYLEDM